MNYQYNVIYISHVVLTRDIDIIAYHFQFYFLIIENISSFYYFEFFSFKSFFFLKEFLIKDTFLKSYFLKYLLYL